MKRKRSGPSIKVMSKSLKKQPKLVKNLLRAPLRIDRGLSRGKKDSRKIFEDISWEKEKPLGFNLRIWFPSWCLQRFVEIRILAQENFCQIDIEKPDMISTAAKVWPPNWQNRKQDAFWQSIEVFNFQIRRTQAVYFDIRKAKLMIEASLMMTG